MLTAGGTLAMVGGRCGSVMAASDCRWRQVSLDSTRPMWLWIFACAEMTEQNMSSGRVRNTPLPEFRWGMQGAKPLCRESEGVPRSQVHSSPMSGGHRGLKGVLMRLGRALDSRLRGNDRGECRDASLPRVWGCPPIPLNYPPRLGEQGG